MAYQRVNWMNDESGNTPINNDNLNVMDIGIFNLDNNKAEFNDVFKGLFKVTETVTYASTDNPTGVVYFSGNVTNKYQVSWRIMLTNAGNIIWGIITSIGSYDSLNNRTPITFLHEIDYPNNTALYLLENSPITNVYISNIKFPYGFPVDKNKWSKITTDSTERIQPSPAQSTWYNLGNVKLKVDIGLWDIEDYVVVYATRSNSGDTKYYATLSTSPNSESDVELTSYSNIALIFSSVITAFGVAVPLQKSKTILVNEKIDYYLNTKTESSSIVNLYNQNDKGKLIIKATCAYY